MTTKSLDESPVNIRVRLAALWTAVMLLYLYGDYFKWYIPNEANKLVNGDTILDSPISLFIASVLMAIPPTVIILTVMARPNLVRWVNVISGTFFSAIMVLIAITSVDPEWAAYVFYAIVESIITMLIVQQAWKWPREKLH